MRASGIFRAAVRPAAFSAAFVCLASIAEAAVPEAAAPQSITGEYRLVVDRLGRLEREVNDLQRATYSRVAARRTEPGTATDGSYGGVSGASQQRLNDLEAALRSLTGRVEELEHRMRQLDARMRRMAASASAGMTPPQTAGRPGGEEPRGAPSGADTAGGLGQPRNLADSMPPPGGPGAGAGMPGGSPAAEPGMPSQPPSRAAQADSGGSSGQGAAASNNPKLSGDEGRDFNTARDLLLKGEFARAGDMFGAIAKAYPKSKLAGDSQFWKAESLFVRELYRDAAEAYLTVARDFPKSAKAPESLVKLARSFDKLGERKQACAALAQIGRRYPKAPEPVRQDAERYKDKFSCA